MSRLESLIDTTKTKIAGLVRDYATGNDKGARDFGKRMATVLADAHAQSAAVGRTVAGVRGNVTKADKQLAQAIVYGKDGETAFLADFVQKLLHGGYTDAEGNPQVKAIAARAYLYADRLTGTANQTFVQASPETASFTWETTDGESCAGCLAMEAGNPHTADSLDKVPGSCQTECLMNCKCTLTRSDGVSVND